VTALLTEPALIKPQIGTREHTAARAHHAVFLVHAEPVLVIYIPTAAADVQAKAGMHAGARVVL